MKSIKFYDRYTWILTISFALLFIFEIIWIQQKFKGNEPISLIFNLILLGIFLVFYIIYCFYITFLFVRMRDEYGLNTKQLLMRRSPLLSPIIYLFELRKLLKQFMQENKNIYS